MSKSLSRIMDKPVRIYLLAPRGTEKSGPAYVGATAKPLMVRLAWHVQAANSRPQMAVSKWLKKIVETHIPIDIHLLEEIPPGGDWEQRESYHIRKYREAGIELLNAADTSFYTGPMSEESKTKISRSLKGHPVSEETKKKIRSARAKQIIKHSDSTRARMRASALGRCIPSSARSKMSDAKKRSWQDPQYRERVLEARRISRLKKLSAMKGLSNGS